MEEYLGNVITIWLFENVDDLKNDNLMANDRYKKTLHSVESQIKGSA